MTNSSVGFPQFYQIQQILDGFLALIRESVGQLHTSGDTALMEELETSLKAQKSRPLSEQQTA